ncbi:S24 family peptidase [Salipiger bermudensis]|nr:S24 family peptidase [Salipiger bermudensis]
MPRTFIEAFQHALATTGRSVRSISLATGVPYERLKQVARGRSATTNADDAYLIARAFGGTYEDFMQGNVSAKPTIAIAGKVGAGAHVPVFDAYEKGDGPQVECPPGLSYNGVVAVEVEGDSMEPVFSAGDLLFYTRDTHDGVPDDVIGHRCVVEDASGMGWVKQVKLGSEPGLFNLISLNPSADNMHDVKLNWAARVRLHWPAELARKT